MNDEHCYGIIPFIRKEGLWQVLLLNHKKGNYWGFPKGHANPAELPKEAAERELFEETELKVKSFLSVHSLHEEYKFYRNNKIIHKTVTYFLAEVEGKIQLQLSEIQDCVWMPLDKVEEIITFSESKALIPSIKKILIICSEKI